LNTNEKVSAILKRFQENRRTARKKKLLELFMGLHDEFDSLVPTITANISNILSLADICHHVDRAAGITKRYKQLADEARHYDLQPPPVPELPENIIEAYVLIVGRRPRPKSKLKGAN
jgi:hypothetical protein